MNFGVNLFVKCIKLEDSEVVVAGAGGITFYDILEGPS